MNMRLIDADKLCEGRVSNDPVVIAAKCAHTVNAIEVVRCNDCKHSAVDNYIKRRMCILYGEVRPNGHIWYGTAVSDDHFCCYGEKIDLEV